jgi:tRNA threonylcarbamoyl adenosine modification protein YeaZ
MRVLAIDTALSACAAAVLDTAGGILASQSLDMARGHAEALMPLVARVMGRGSLGFADLDRIAVTTGPGSFTGLRVGIAAARGIALATAKPAFGISTLAALAAPYLASDDGISVVTAIDARHGHVYLQVFGPGGRVVVTPRLSSLADAAAAAAETGARLVGSGAPAIAEILHRNDIQPAGIDPRAAPDIAWVARIGATLTQGQAPPRPEYLQPPDARPQHAAQLPRR